MLLIPIAFASAVVRFACCSTTTSRATRSTGESAAASSLFDEARTSTMLPGLEGTMRMPPAAVTAKLALRGARSTSRVSFEK